MPKPAFKLLSNGPLVERPILLGGHNHRISKAVSACPRRERRSIFDEAGMMKQFVLLIERPGRFLGASCAG